MSLTNEQYDSLMRLYARRQAESRQELEERLDKIQLKIPELKELHERSTAFRAQKVRLAVEGRTEEQERLEHELIGLSEKRLNLLSSHGYSPEDLNPVYHCPDCQDTGYIKGRKCHCLLQAEIDLLYHQSHLKDILKRENFQTFSYSWYEGEDQEVMRRNVAQIHLFIENFDSDFENLLLLGAVGTGKTFLSNCIAKELLDTCHSVVYLTAFELFDRLSAAAFGEKEIYSQLFDCDLLIIDDLGTELSNSLTVSQFFLCINERILRRKSTLISSNLDMDALSSIYSERTLSRIISCYTIRELPGSDIRIKKKFQTNL